MLVTLLTIKNIYSQTRINSYWEFETNIVILFGDTIQVQSNGRIVNSECSSSICDSFGNLLFYTDGLRIWNRFHKIVKNSEGIGFPYSNIYSTSRQGSLLLQANDHEVYFFNTDFQGSSGGLNYSVIDIHSNSDSGEVIIKKKQLVGNTNEAIASINHQNNQDIWIIAHDLLIANKFYKFILTSEGIKQCKLEQIEGPTNYNGLLTGQTNMKISPDGKYLARTVGNFCILELFRFDDLSGELDFIKVIESNPGDIISGIEFSKNSDFLYYVKRDSSIVQYDISNNIKKVLKWSIDGGTQQIQIAPDGKIYVAVAYDKYLDVIENPETNKAKYIDSAIYLKGNETFTGIPSFNQSYFKTPSIEFNYQLNCMTNEIEISGMDTFSATMHSWQITKNSNVVGSYSGKNISYSFNDTGNHQIRYIASSGSRNDTVFKTIKIYPKIKRQFLGKDTAYAQGEVFNKILKSPPGIICQLWQDSSSLSTFSIDSAGVYVCKVTNQAFCEVRDTIQITECINNLDVPSLFRSRDSLYVTQTMADSFIWFRNNVIYKFTKEPFLPLIDTGSYRVEAAKKGFCNKSSNVYQINKLGVNSIQLSDFNIQLYPNPSKGEIFIISVKNFELKVYDIAGKLISSHANIDRLNLPKGLYFFWFEVDGVRLVEKVVVI